MLSRNIFTFVFLVLFPVLLSAEPQLSVRLDRSAVYEGESFVYQLVLSDTSRLDAGIVPDTSAWADFDVRLLDRQTMQHGGSSFTMMFNGQTVRDERTSASYSTRYIYALTPKQAGSHIIPLPRVAINGKALPLQSFSVEEGEQQLLPDYSVVVQVLGPEEQDFVFMSLVASRHRLYPLQPLEVTLTVQVKGLPDRYAGIDPLSFPRQSQQLPQLQIPWADENPKGFSAPQKLDDWLRSFLVRTPRGGFGINDYTGNRNIFSFSSAPLQFSSVPRQIKRYNSQGNETVYWEYRFSRTLMPQEFGNYSFGPVTLKGMLPVADAQVPNRIVWQRVYALARPISVTVADVPQEDRPADYIGAFGSFRWEANLTPRQARVGDPMTLTLHLSGEGSTVNVRPLDLSANPDLSANFRVHMPPTEEVNERFCAFTYTIRPLKPGVIEFPPISVSVFDVNTEKFVPLRSLPIRLDIAESETVQSATVFSDISGGADGVQLSAGGLFANKTTLVQTLPPMSFEQWAVAVVILGGTYAVIAFGVLLLRCQWTNPRCRRQRGAYCRATSRLAEVSSALAKGDSANLVKLSSELQGVFFGYIADKFDSMKQGMTTSDACRLLLEKGIAESLVDTIRAVLESLDAVKYGGSNVRSLDELANTASALLDQMNRAGS